MIAIDLGHISSSVLTSLSIHRFEQILIDASSYLWDSVPHAVLEAGSGYGSRRRSPFSRLFLLLDCFFTLKHQREREKNKKRGSRRPRVNMAASQERLISLAELQMFRIAGAKERNVSSPRT